MNDEVEELLRSVFAEGGATADQFDGEKTEVRREVERYRSLGIAVCRIRAGEKNPTDKAWTTRSAEADEFGRRHNVGLQCGWISNGGQPGQFLVCVDIDNLDAIAVAEEYLPPTGAVEGRDGKPRSHRWYNLTGPIPAWAESKAEASVAAARAGDHEPGPALRHFTHAETGEGLFDFVGTGGQTVAPPSLHPSGERRRWEEGCDITKAATLPFMELYAAVRKFALAINAKLPKEWPEEDSVQSGVGEAVPFSAIESAAAVAGGVKGTPTRECGVPMEERVRRCEAYLKEEAPLARSGHGGHKTTFRVALDIVNDFAVDDPAEAARLFDVYNQRLKEEGELPWSPGDLKHKLDGAFKRLERGSRLNNPYGCRLAGDTNRDADEENWRDPSRLADAFVQARPLLYFSGRYFVYNGRNYDEVDENTLKAQVWGFVEGEARRHDPEHPPKLQRSLRDNVLAAIQARGVKRLNGRSHEVVFNGWLPGTGRSGDTLVMQNGLFDVATGTLSPHTPDFFGLYCLPYDFDPEARCPTWEQAVGRICGGDAELVRLIQQWFGYCLTSSTDQQRFMVLVGEGSNGKSTLAGGLLAVVGAANASHVPLEKFSGTFELGYTLGKLVNLPDDMSEIDRANEGVLKTYTSGGAMSFNQKNRPILFARPTAKLMFSTNTVPRFTDRSSGLWRRLLLVPLSVVIPEAERVKGMDKPDHWAKLGETAGMLNWALAGLKSLQEVGFVVPECVRAAVAEHQIESNPTRLFLSEHVEAAEGRSIPSRDLFSVYKVWAEQNNHGPMGHIQFTKELRRVFPGATRGTKTLDGKPKRVIQGVGWTAEHIAWREQRHAEWEAATEDTDQNHSQEGER